MGLLSYNKIVLVANLCLIVTVIKPICCNSVPNMKGRLFVFGDSMYDTGNNKYVNQNGYDPATHWPYGMSLNTTSSGRYSDGYLVPDYIANFANLNNIRPFTEPGTRFSYIDGVNFASAGVNLTSQLANMMTVVNSLRGEFGFEQTSTILGKSVFLVGLTGDDYLIFATNSPNASPEEIKQYIDNIISNLTALIKDIYGIGGRRFAFQNLPPIGCLPAVKQFFNVTGDDCVPIPQQIASYHNFILSLIMNFFESIWDGFKHSVFDYYSQLTDRINNPQNYGFKIGNMACCGNGTYRGSSCGSGSHEVCSNPNEYVFFDGGHVTQNLNLQLALQFWNGTGDTTKPYTVRELFELP